MTREHPDADKGFVVLGEALVDLVQSREHGGFDAHAGGSPYNVAITLGRLGAVVAFAGQGGDDSFGDLLTDRLARSGVRLQHWRRLRRPSSLAVAALDDRGRADYRFYFDGTAGLEFDDPAALPDVAVLHTGSIASWLPPSARRAQQAMRQARERGALVSYDPNVRADLMGDGAAVRAAIETCVRHAHVVKASDDDLAVLFGPEPPGEVARRWCALGAHLVVITRGAAGAIAFGPGGVLAECPAPEIQVADTVGAGDAFTGGLLFALAGTGLASPSGLAHAVDASDPRLRSAIRTAVTVSSITCERPGANPPTLAELTAREDVR